MEKKLLTIGETAELLGVSIDTLRKWDEKNILNSFRPSSTGNRYYLKEDLEKFLRQDSEEYKENLSSLAIEWATNQSPTSISPNVYCETNDIFSARLQRLSSELQGIAELKDIFPLTVAITGEIGNNSYNHNIGNWPDVQGVFFGYNIKKREIVLADRGRGILKTLQRVLPNLKNDQEAVEVAFTKYISARAPEDRGNGLKFVRDVIASYPLKLKFFTGNAAVELGEGSTELNIKETDKSFHGCIAIINY